MKPRENVSGDPLFISSSLPAKSQGSINSPASEALQLLLADSVDSKSIMFDLSKLLADNPNFGLVNGQQRVIVSTPGYEGSQQTQQGLAASSPGMGIAIPKREPFSNIGQADLDETFFGQNGLASSSGAYAAGSSYGTSPLPPASPVYWDPSQIQIKEEDPSGLPMPTGPARMVPAGQARQIPRPSYSPGDVIYYHQSEPTLAQLNSPPAEDITMTTLRNLEDLDSISLDLDILTSDMLFPGGQYTDIKVEPGPGGSGMFQWGKESQLSSSVPLSVISNAAEYQQELSNMSSMSNGGPAISPSRLTLSPSRIGGTCLSPTLALSSASRPGLSPPHRPANLSPNNTQPLSPQGIQGSRSPHNSALHELLMRPDTIVPDPIRPRSNSNQFKSAKRPIAARQRNSLSISNPLLASQLSKSAPVKTLPIEQMIWSRRDPRPHMNSVCSNAGDSSIADEVSEIMNSLSPSELNDIDSEDETNNEIETDDDLRIDEDGESAASKKERHFWMYNVQAKGPKGQKLALDTKIEDPHQLNEIIDPVFSDSVQVHGIKHSGKARRGDGNDLTANPKKLAVIGKELDRLNKEINQMTPVSEVPFLTRTKSRKEKNKLASRACRLKKKAQHEANKLKLHGLEEEHIDLMRSINHVKEILNSKWNGGSVGGGSANHEELTAEAEKILKRITKNRVAGTTTEYVNRMIVKYS